MRSILVLAAMLAGAGVFPPAQAAQSAVPLHNVWQDGAGTVQAGSPAPVGRTIEGSSQTVEATADGATITVVTNGLEAGHAYTLWFGFFNHPESCVERVSDSLRCGAADFANPLADLSLVYGDGLVATGTNDRFVGYRPAGVVPTGVEQIAWGTGVLTNPLGAEYQVVLRNHGPSDPDYPDQTTTQNGGCREGQKYTCTDDQASGFRAQFPFTLLK